MTAPLSSRVRQALSFRDGTPFAHPLDAALSDAVAYLEKHRNCGCAFNNTGRWSVCEYCEALTRIERALSAGGEK